MQTNAEATVTCPVQKTKPSLVRTLFELLLVTGCTLVFALNAAGIAVTLLTDNYAGARDFVTYWASGQQLVHRANPYDAAAVLQLEHSVGFSLSAQPLIMRNAPPSLIMVLPLGFLSIRAASLLWSVLMLVSLWLSIRTIALLNNRARSPLNLLAYSFAPVLSCLIAGQMGLFVLLGLSLFLRTHKTQPLIAGASLWLCALKPHLFLPFGLVLLVWIIATKRYKILLGAVAAFALTTGFVLALDPLAFAHYGQMMKAAEIGNKLIPCISTIIRMGIDKDAVWLQWLPAALGCAWALAYYRRHRDDWDWMEHGSLLMLVSFVVAPYSWYMDQGVLLPAILYALYRTQSRNMIALLAVMSTIVEVANLRGVPLGNALLYPWTGPAWLLWFLIATRLARAQKQRDSEQTGTGVTPVLTDA